MTYGKDMIRLIRNIMPALILLASVPAYAATPEEKEARDWCDTSPLSDVEGIWEYPEDGARVLIKADKGIPGTFSITMLSTPDCRLEPGDIIGRLYPTVDTRQFRLKQMTRKEGLSFAKPADCTAILSADGESLRVKSMKFKFKINLNTLLPRFWRLVRVSADNPVDDLPAGLVKIYPGYDHNGSMRRKQRIL